MVGQSSQPLVNGAQARKTVAVFQPKVITMRSALIHRQALVLTARNEVLPVCDEAFARALDGAP